MRRRHWLVSGEKVALHTQTPALIIKIEYHSNESPLKKIEKKRICWWKVNVSNNKKTYHARFFFNAIKFLGLYIKNSIFYSEIYCQN